MDKIILEVKGLEKSFGEIKAVKGVSFSVKKGEKFVFVGPNGAGKSTTINIISTLLRPDAGEVFYDNLQLARMMTRSANGSALFSRIMFWMTI